MTLSDLIKKTALTPTVLCNPEAVAGGVYVGDLLSRAMGKLRKNDLWVTIMTNKNVVAVGSLSEVSAVILAEGTVLPPDALEAAKENRVNVLSTDLSAYELCVALSLALGGTP